MRSVNDQVFDAWKQQAEFGLKLIEAMVQSSVKLRGMQEAAGKEAQRRAAEAGQSIARAKDPQELWQAQYEMAMRNCEDAVVYWRNVFDTIGELNGRMLECVKEGAPKVLPPLEIGAEAPSGTLAVPGDLVLRLWSDMYRQADTFARGLSEAVGASRPASKDAGKKRSQDEASA